MSAPSLAKALFVHENSIEPGRKKSLLFIAALVCCAETFAEEANLTAKVLDLDTKLRIVNIF